MLLHFNSYYKKLILFLHYYIFNQKPTFYGARAPNVFQVLYYVPKLLLRKWNAKFFQLFIGSLHLQKKVWRRSQLVWSGSIRQWSLSAEPRMCTAVQVRKLSQNVLALPFSIQALHAVKHPRAFHMWPHSTGFMKIQTTTSCQYSKEKSKEIWHLYFRSPLLSLFFGKDFYSSFSF